MAGAARSGDGSGTGSREGVSALDSAIARSNLRAKGPTCRKAVAGSGSLNRPARGIAHPSRIGGGSRLNSSASSFSLARCRSCLRRATRSRSACHFGSSGEFARELMGADCQYAVRHRAQARGGSGQPPRGVHFQPQRVQVYLPIFPAAYLGRSSVITVPRSGFQRLTSHAAGFLSPLAGTTARSLSCDPPFCPVLIHAPHSASARPWLCASLWYNFCRVHQSFRVTPSMAVGIATEIWPLERLLV